MLTVFLWRWDESVHTRCLEGCRPWAALSAFTCYCCNLPPPRGSLQSLPVRWKHFRGSLPGRLHGLLLFQQVVDVYISPGGILLLEVREGVFWFLYSLCLAEMKPFYLVGFSSLEKEKVSPQMPTRWSCESTIVMNRNCRKRRLRTNLYQAHLLGAGATDPWNLCSTYISRFSSNMCFIKRSFQMLGKNSKRAGWETLLYWTTILWHLCIDVISFRGHWMNKSLQSLCRACTSIPVF